MAIYARLENGTYAEVTGVYKTDGTEITEIFQGERLVYSATNEIYGTVPLYYDGLGYELIDYLISGNTVQDGTPSSDAPVDVVGCGVRTGNLLSLNRTYSYRFTVNTKKWMNGAATVNLTGDAYAESEILGDVIKVTSKNPGYGASFLIEASPNTTYTVSFETDKTSSGSWGGISDRDINGAVISSAAIQGKSATFTTHSNCAFLNVCFRFPPADGTVIFSNIMLNLGSEALPYEPYGFKLPLTVNGTEYPIYLGTVPTTRRVKKLVLTGEETITSYTGFGAENCFFVSKSGAVAGAGLCNIYSNVSILRDFIRTNNSFMNSTNTVRIHDSRFASPDDLKSYLAAQYAAGTPVTVWYVLAEPETGIVNEPLMKIGDYADTVSFAQSGVTIPTVSGANVLDMASTVKPSEVYIKGKGIKPTGYGQLADVNGVNILDKDGRSIYVHGQ